MKEKYRSEKIISESVDKNFFFKFSKDIISEAEKIVLPENLHSNNLKSLLISDDNCQKDIIKPFWKSRQMIFVCSVCAIFLLILVVVPDKSDYYQPASAIANEQTFYENAIDQSAMADIQDESVSLKVAQSPNEDADHSERIEKIVTGKADKTDKNEQNLTKEEAGQIYNSDIVKTETDKSQEVSWSYEISSSQFAIIKNSETYFLENRVENIENTITMQYPLDGVFIQVSSDDERVYILTKSKTIQDATQIQLADSYSNEQILLSVFEINSGDMTKYMIHGTSSPPTIIYPNLFFEYMDANGDTQNQIITIKQH